MNTPSPGQPDDPSPGQAAATEVELLRPKDGTPDFSPDEFNDGIEPILSENIVVKPGPPIEITNVSPNKAYGGKQSLDQLRMFEQRSRTVIKTNACSNLKQKAGILPAIE